jgi:hypothetical protein
MLISDITVRAMSAEPAGRLALYGEGTIRYAGEARFGRQLYRAGAFLPRGEVRAVSESECALLSASGAACGRSRTIGIVPIAPQLIAALRAARGGEGRVEAQRLLEFPFNELAAAIAPAWRLQGPLLPLGFGRNPAGFLTVTFDAAAERFIGLHVDDLDALPIARRADSTARLCVNLGTSERYLLFVNVGLARMAALLSALDPATDFGAWRSTPLIHAFLERFPCYPLVRLAIRPGEAYIAPTENMIHDASTSTMQAMDEQVTVRGGFDPL